MSPVGAHTQPTARTLASTWGAVRPSLTSTVPSEFDACVGMATGTVAEYQVMACDSNKPCGLHSLRIEF